MDAVVDINMINEMRLKGYSRIPVYYGDNKSFILGILIVKTLIGADI
jgi:CBS domain containing-hemolysin-like protein